jgi:hypothetical protein
MSPEGDTGLSKEPYAGSAERYDWMKEETPARRAFFQQLFAENQVTEGGQ